MHSMREETVTPSFHILAPGPLYSSPSHVTKIKRLQILHYNMDTHTHTRVYVLGKHLIKFNKHYHKHLL